jgi:hypothetical protein
MRSEIFSDRVNCLLFIYYQLTLQLMAIRHMGLTAVERRSEDLDKLLSALKFAVQNHHK